MYTVFRWFNDEEDPYTIQIGYFISESTAYTFMDFYALVHKVSLDDLTLGYEDLDKFLERLGKKN